MSRETVSPYRARGLLADPHVQSVLSSSPWRKRAGLARLRALGASGERRILDLPGGVRLAGVYYAAAPARARGALALLLHGWEGSVESSYINHSAAALLEAGVDVFALNFRDHGGTHHLNEGLFHSCRLEEVLDAARAVRALYAPRRFVVAGYSLGGNFALRLALAAGRGELGLDGAFAVCPPVDPSAVLRELETGPAFYHWYFMRKWRGSLKRKRALFPQAHAFEEDILRYDMRGLTRWLVARHGDWGDEERYFEGYAVSGDRLAGLAVPVRILAAADDPVIPVASLRALALPDSATLEISAHGGHCGFILDRRLHGYAERWLENGVTALLDRLQ